MAPLSFRTQILIVTDQQPLKHMLEQRIITLEQQKFVAKHMGFDFEIKYRLGKQNVVADALSRRDDVADYKQLADHIGTFGT